MRVFLGCLFAAGLAFSARGQAELIGHVLDQVRCEADQTQSYALYIPSGYVSQKKWPVIFCFDPRGRGRIPVERLQAAGEKYGYIVAGSLNSRNGPWEANVPAIQAMVRDVSAHFSVDSRRIYTAGLSGGARVATALGLSGMAKGVIACSAGFPTLPDGLPDQIPFGFFGTAGVEDFNYGEMQRLDGELEERKAAHRIVIFNGGHEWAPEPLMTEAVEWLELQAVRAGTRSKDDEFAQAAFRRRLGAIPAQPALERWRALKSLIADFDRLVETGELVREAKTLGASREVKDALKAERSLSAREEALLTRLEDTATASVAKKKNLAAELRLKTDVAEDSAERQMVRRAVAGFFVMTREPLQGMFDEKEYDKAAAFLELAAALRPEEARNWYDLARARAFGGDKKRALESLEQAATTGFGDPQRTETEPAFAKLRSDAAFQSVLAKMRAEPPVQMAPVRVSAALANIELRLFYLPNAGTDVPPLSFLRVETVRPGSAAARAGIAEGMEITAIQGRRIRGLTDVELEGMMKQPVKNEIVLTLRESARASESEVRVPFLKTPVSPETSRANP